MRSHSTLSCILSIMCGWGFWILTKICLWVYNARKVVTISKLEEQLTVGKVTAADKSKSDPYASYGQKFLM